MASGRALMSFKSRFSSKIARSLKKLRRKLTKPRVPSQKSSIVKLAVSRCCADLNTAHGFTPFF